MNCETVKYCGLMQGLSYLSKCQKYLIFGKQKIYVL